MPILVHYTETLSGEAHHFIKKPGKCFRLSWWEGFQIVEVFGLQRFYKCAGKERNRRLCQSTVLL